MAGMLGASGSLMDALRGAGRSAKPKKKSGTGGTKAPEQKSHGPATSAPNPGAGGTPYDAQISAESLLRFGPEETALAQALRDVKESRDSDVAAAHGAARGAILTAKLAQPGLKAVTGDVLGQIDQAIGGAGGIPATGGLNADLARTKTRLAERLGLASSELTARQTAAAEGEQYAVNAANSRAGENQRTIMERLISLGGEKGAYGAARAAELSGEAMDRDLEAAKADAQNATTLAAAGVNPDGTIVPGGAKDPAANGTQARIDAARAKSRAKTLATPEDHQEALAAIQQATAIAKKLKGRLSRAEAAQILVSGAAGKDPEPVYEQVDDGHGGKKWTRAIDPATGTPRTKGGRQAVDPVKPLWASIALDLAYDGGVSANNVKRLHNPQKRYSVKELGLTTQHQRIVSGEIPDPRHPRPAQLSPAQRAPGGT